MALYGTRVVWSIVIAVNGATPLREKTAFFDSLEIKNPELAGIVGEDM